MKITTGSLVDYGSPGATVDVDPFAVNGLADEALQLSVIKPKGVAPKMFSAGSSDLPTITASGLDPRLLLGVPYRTRHFLAALADPAELYGLFEDLTSQPNAVLMHPGLQEAVQRVRRWALGEEWK